MDVEVSGLGSSVVLFTPISAAAREWVDEHVALESWQWLGSGFGVDHRFVEPLIDGMTSAGLSVGE